ncbi:MAG: (d)CMP kinase [Chloroflexota bacterium]|nr:(d)CMP kinase [Chloroflexota bacterium]
MSPPQTIAIDGPAGVGKSTIGRLLADQHGYVFLDTGALYRAVSLAALQHGTDASDALALAALADALDIRFLPPLPGSSAMYRVCLDGADVTDGLRSPEVEAIVSEVSAHPQVRAALLARQRELARTAPSVLVGRDIGTVVLPDADLKVFLEASLEERSRRRFLELQAKGREVDLQTVLAELQHRDRIDSGRAASPLRVPDDAIVIDTDNKPVEQVLEEIEQHMRSR